MFESFEPRIDILPKAQREIWHLLAPAKVSGFVLYGGTAVALHLGHRTSIDFDFFRSQPLDKTELVLMNSARMIQEDSNTLVGLIDMPSGSVKVSFYGGLNIGRLNRPLSTTDDTLLVASQEDLLATKLKAILDRAEAKDYLDIAALLAARVSLERSLAAFVAMYGKDAGLPLRALGYFEDGDLPSLPLDQQVALRAARDRVTDLPTIKLTYRSLADSEA